MGISYLSHLLFELNFTTSLAHCNFQLRAKESDLDEEFVKLFSQKTSNQIYIKLFDTNNFAKEHKLSTQIAARELRYKWFQELAKEYHFDYILTAHHADDQVETVLMQFFRGTGLHGLTGIPAMRTHQQNPLATDHINLIRPLLPFSKASIKDFAKLNGLDYVEDSSNLKNDYTRNLIRNQLIPQMEIIYPNVNQQILDTISRLKEAEDIVDRTVTSFWKKHTQEVINDNGYAP